uniref:Uncharacterized protein n=1 Tax=Timema genevievae TaxID=629358 RepID=A0A7R9KBE8_TIMGE|nr:unnamed protein product [Timema genevievae]
MFHSLGCLVLSCSMSTWILKRILWALLLPCPSPAYSEMPTSRGRY